MGRGRSKRGLHAAVSRRRIETRPQAPRLLPAYLNLSKTWEAAIKAQQEFLSGVMFVVIALAFVVVGWNLPHGTAMNMGPGYMPLGTALILGLIGLVSMARGFVHHGRGVEPVSLRPFLLVPLAMTVFGMALDQLGMVAAIVLAVFIGRAAVREARLGHTLILAVGLAALCVGLFYYGFGLPVRLWPRF